MAYPFGSVTQAVRFSKSSPLGAAIASPHRAEMRKVERMLKRVRRCSRVLDHESMCSELESKVETQKKYLSSIYRRSFV
jgi:hypothetical protein